MLQNEYKNAFSSTDIYFNNPLSISSTRVISK